MTNERDAVADPKGKALIEGAADVAGSATGAALGLLFGGPPGAIIGGAAGPAFAHSLRWVLGEVAHRTLGEREKVRVGAVLAFAVEAYERRVDEGRRVRQDGFFDDVAEERAAGNEVIEGVILAAQRLHEERKLRYLGNLLAGIAFAPDVDPALANHLIRLADQLSYRQLCLLALVADQDRFALPRTDRRAPGMKWADWGTGQEFTELGRMRLVEGLRETTPNLGMSLPSNIPLKARPIGAGVLLDRLMELRTIPEEDLRLTADSLSRAYDERGSAVP